MAQDTPFQRDLGYLDRFLEKLREHAAGLADRAAGDRLSALMDEEVRRWGEIRALLGDVSPGGDDVVRASQDSPGEGQASGGGAADEAAAPGDAREGGAGAAEVRAAPEPPRSKGTGPAVRPGQPAKTPPERPPAGRVGPGSGRTGFTVGPLRS